MRRPPRSATDSRRQFLKRAAATLGVAGLTSTAGCLGDVRDNVSPPATAIGGTSAIAETALSKDAFDAYATRQREQYGDHGIWGAADSEPEHDLEFVGAWTRTIGVTADGSPAPQPEGPGDLRAVADSVVAAYEIPDRSTEEKQHYQLWLWAAGRLPGEADDGPVAATPGLRRVEIGVELTGGDAEMGAYTPGSDHSRGPVTVGPASPDVDGLAASVPLETGQIRVVPDRTGFDKNAYAVAWTGDHDGQQAVAATCETAWDGDSAPQFELSVRLAADRRRL
ncbi:hypothetical protein SY89_00173 [Halolamina pelagica]|uniref:Tat (Twin-arginine translocation) pathway signal sequence n=1 Tax=Halolamina pelagica TaxID=699431 RepID=A0A0P7GLM6_9EURY|nr:twin-arginine translocation signal domain-containing protein [Halolamina pelagica]KPN29460.1 hypothetical protein SY89_00173 [Halolamina pelagica]